MKRRVDRLDESDFISIENWLLEPHRLRVSICPFITTDKKDGALCKVIFPQLPRNEYRRLHECEWNCPCEAYSMNYVTHVARKIIAEKGG